MNLNLEGKKVLVTGGSKGIGKAIAAAFVKEGASVGIAGRDLEALQTASSEMGASIFQGDVTKSEDRKRIFESFIETFSTIDILVNNAGGSNGADVMSTTIQDFESAMQLNYLSAVSLSQLTAKIMMKNKSGAILNISSIFGRESGGKPTYNASKAAMISFTKSFADEMIPYGIRVNGIAPGSILHETGNWKKRLEENPEAIQSFVKTHIPGGRFGTVQEIADVALFLASERASWVVGATLNVDGGQSYSNF